MQNSPDMLQYSTESCRKMVRRLAPWKQGVVTMSTLEVLTLLMLLVDVIALVLDHTKH